MNLYKNGEFMETFKGARELPRLKDFLKKYAKPEAPEPVAVIEAEPSRIYNPSGTVTVLDDSNFQATLDDGPVFAKFYAPWCVVCVLPYLDLISYLSRCGHCKKLAPAWKNLAQSMQNKLTVAEVDCEAHKALCKNQNIEGFPTLVFYAGGSRSDYNGGRKLEQLQKFAEKASGAYVSLR
jgi:thiol-disulfide isomerase/thioredoxin